MILDKCRTAVFPEYHSMGRLLNLKDNKQVGRILKDSSYLFQDIPIEDSYSFHFWAFGKKCSLKSDILDIDISNDDSYSFMGRNINTISGMSDSWNNLIIQRRSGKTSLYINGHCKHTEINNEHGNINVEIICSQNTSEKSPLRDFRFYDRFLSGEEIEKLSKFIGYGYTPDIFKYIKEFQEVYASNAANMFPTHF